MTTTTTLAPASDPHPLAVYDGTILVGRLIRHGDNFEAIDVDGTSHGLHADMKSAAFALPKRSES